MIPLKKTTTVQVSTPLGNLCWPIVPFHSVSPPPSLFAPQIKQVTSVVGFITLHYALLFPWVIFSGRVWGLWDQGQFDLFEKLILNPITWWDLNEWTKCSSKLLLLKHYMQELGEVGVSNKQQTSNSGEQVSECCVSLMKVSCLGSYFKLKVL